MQETFDVPEFKATSKSYRRFGRKNTLIMEGNKPQVFDVPRTKGRATFDWLQKNGLETTSFPVEWVRSSLTTNERNLNGKRITMFEKWTTHANVKVSLMNASQPHSLCP